MAFVCVTVKHELAAEDTRGARETYLQTEPLLARVDELSESAAEAVMLFILELNRRSIW